MSEGKTVAQTWKDKEEAEIRLYGALWWLAKAEVISQSKAMELANVSASEWQRQIRLLSSDD